MGFRISWLAARYLSKPELLESLGFGDTGVHDEANEAPFSCAALPTGWTVLWSNDPTYARIALCTPLSLRSPIVSCWVNETSMFSSVNYFDRGEYLWFFGHDAQNGVDHLQSDAINPSNFGALVGNQSLNTSGLGSAAPPDISDIVAHHRSLQANATEQGISVDYMFDVPIEIARKVCGFRHDLCEFEWGVPEFTIVDPIAEISTEYVPGPVSDLSKTPKRGWLGRLFGTR